MDLIHSLTVAESLQTPKSAPGRFRMTQHSLPKFAAAKGPLSLRPAQPVKPEVLPGETGSLFESPAEPKPAEARISHPANTDATGSPFCPGVKLGKAGEAEGEFNAKAQRFTPFHGVQRVEDGKISEGMEGEGRNAKAQRRKDAKMKGGNRVEGEGPGEKAPVRERRGSRIFREVPWLGGRPGGAREREVQPEWALDRVTVARNDLSESDLEVVPGRREEAKAGPFTLEAARREKRPRGSIWRRLRAKLRFWR
jgi:hypothetical protein